MSDSVSGEDQRVTPKARRKMRRWTAEQRQQMVAESLMPGATVREVAARHDINAPLLCSWRAQQAASAGKARPAFAAVRVSAPSSALEGVIEIDLASRCIRVRGIVDGAMLREVLTAAR